MSDGASNSSTARRLLDFLSKLGQSSKTLFTPVSGIVPT